MAPPGLAGVARTSMAAGCYKLCHDFIQGTGLFMDDIKLNLIMLAIFVLLGGGIFLLVRRGQAANEEKITRMAAERDWTARNLSENHWPGVCASKSNKWTLRSLIAFQRPRSRPRFIRCFHADHLACWNSLTERLLIGPRTSPANLGPLGESLTRQSGAACHRPRAPTAWLKMPRRTKAFRQKYMVWAQDPVEAKTRLTPALESALAT